MSSDLPARPSLEYLKKLAKERLHQLQQQNPSAKLADAQHAIAREYGFLNWSQLKDSVTSSPALPASAPASPYTGLFARFTDRAKRATFFSRFEAGQLGHPSIDPEHLMIGVIRARDGLSRRILADVRFSPDHLRKDVSERRASGDPLGFGVDDRIQRCHQACRSTGSRGSRSAAASGDRHRASAARSASRRHVDRNIDPPRARAQPRPASSRCERFTEGGAVRLKPDTTYDYFPTSRGTSFSFSRQAYSRRSVSSAMCWLMFTVHGFV